MAAGQRDCRGDGEEGSDPFVLDPPGRQTLPTTQSVETVVLVCYVSNRALSHIAPGPRESPSNPKDPLGHDRCWDKEDTDGHEERDRRGSLDNAVGDRMDSHQNRTGAMVEGIVSVGVDGMDLGPTPATASLRASGRCAPEGGHFRCRSRLYTIGSVAFHGHGTR